MISLKKYIKCSINNLTLRFNQSTNIGIGTEGYDAIWILIACFMQKENFLLANFLLFLTHQEYLFMTGMRNGLIVIMSPSSSEVF